MTTAWYKKNHIKWVGQGIHLITNEYGICKKEFIPLSIYRSKPDYTIFRDNKNSTVQNQMTLFESKLENAQKLQEEIEQYAQQNFGSRDNTFLVRCLDTNVVSILDIDHPECWNKELLKNHPYYLSVSKNLPKIFVKLKMPPQEKQPFNTRICNGKIEVHTGIWSYSKIDETIINDDKPILEADFDEVIKQLNKESGTEEKFTPLDEKEVQESMSKPIDEEQLQEILNNLDSKRYDDYYYWVRVGMILRVICNETDGFRLWKMFSKKSKKFVESDWEIINRRKFKSFDKNGDLKLGTLLFYLKEDDIKTFLKICKDNYEKKRFHYFSKMLHNFGHYTIAFYCVNYILDGRYKYCEIEKKWFCVNDNNIWCMTDGIPSCLMNEVYIKISQLIDNHILYCLRKIENSDPKKLDESLLEEMDESTTFAIKNMKSVEKQNAGIITYYKKQIIKLNDLTFREKLCKNISNLVKHHLFRTELNTKHHLLAFKDCLYDFKQGRFRPIEINDNISKYIEYNKPTHDPIKRKALQDFIEGYFFDKKDSLYLLKVLSYMLVRTNPLQEFYIFCGNACNGKGRVMSLLQKAMGSQYFITMSSKSITTSPKTPNTPSDWTRTRGACFTLFNEPSTSDNYFQSETIKTISGMDAITERGLYRDTETFIPSCKFGVVCNKPLDVLCIDDAIIRRFRLVWFPYKFVTQDEYDKYNEKERKKNFIKLRRNDIDDFIEEHYEEFILWLIEIYNEYVKNKSFISMSPLHKLYTDKYIEVQNYIVNFMNENCLQSDNKKELFSKVYNRFKDLEKSTGRYTRETMFRDKLERLGYTIKRSTENKLYIYNIQLTQEQDSFFS